MPESASPSEDEAAALGSVRVVRLSSAVAAIIVQAAQPITGPLAPVLDGQPLKRPHLISRFDRAAGGGHRALVIARVPALSGGGVLALTDTGGAVVARATITPSGADGVAPLVELLRDLDPRDFARTLKSLLDGAAALFQQQADPDYVMACRALLDALFPPPGTPAAMVAAAPGYVHCRGALPLGIGAIETAVVLGTARLWRNPFEPAVRAGAAGALAFDLLVGLAESGRPPAALVLFGEAGVCCRRIPPAAPRRLVDWLSDGRAGPSRETRQYVLRALGAEAVRNQTAAAVLREAQLGAPVAPREVRNPADPVGAGIDLALGHGAGGLFVKGWLRDPYGAVERIVAVAPDGARRTLDAPFARFPRPDVEQAYAGSPHPLSDANIGFATFLPGDAPAYPVFQYRFEVVLRSGRVLDVAPPLRAATPRQGRDDVLGAVPQSRLTPHVIEETLATPVASLQRAVLAEKRAPEVIAIGTPTDGPAVSLVIPLYRNLDYLRFQFGAFALDPAMAGAELIYVLDSPEQRDQVEHILRMLVRLYALPATLVVMSGNFGFSSACNAGAAAARSDALLFVNSDVVPVAPGWMAPLQATVAAHSHIAMAGPKLLFDDDSLQHAGLYFDRDVQGRWYNHHYHKGYPREYPAACVARLVPGVTAATMLVRRAVFESLGGFDEEYVVGDFEDSDLCLKVRAAGHEIAYVPESALYHYERQSIELHPGYTQTAANLYNQWRHDRRWRDLMGAVMARPYPALAELAADLAPLPAE
ncbi:glycosyltransferase [Azospirillum sp.]|uniref:glycosyltransferase n=1 Tax=Azospirillum sp. TaxID=34012 RepID=UPI002D3DE170|nr:glycosyltransferase [Azospirillum sp.]HYD69472.1 glycosyltransferase [Azospirillum sp.]